VYIKIQKLGFCKATYRFPILTCPDVIKWIQQHLDTKITTLNSVIGQNIASYLAHDIELVYQLPKIEGYMDSPLYVFNGYLNTKDIIKTWLKEPDKFH